MRRILLGIIILFLLTGVQNTFAAADLVEVKTRVDKVQSNVISGPNAPTGMDKVGYVGVILGKIFDTTGRIKNEFVSAFQTIQGNYINNILKWDGDKFVTGTMSDVSGNIGIGTLTPTQKLEVNGNILTTGGRIFFRNLNQKIVGDNESAMYVNSNSGSTSQLILRDSGNRDYGRITGGANGALFGLVDGDGDWSYINRKDVYSEFRINDSKIMTMLANGNIGIGTETPIQKLVVDGKIQAQTPDPTDGANIVATKGYVDSKAGGNSVTIGGVCFEPKDMIVCNWNWSGKGNDDKTFVVDRGGGCSGSYSFSRRYTILAQCGNY